MKKYIIYRTDKVGLIFHRFEAREHRAAVASVVKWAKENPRTFPDKFCLFHPRPNDTPECLLRRDDKVIKIKYQRLVGGLREETITLNY